MIWNMRRKISRQFIRYLIIGSVSYALEICFLLTLHKVIGFSAELSTAISFWFGLTISFLLQKIVAFKDYKREVNIIIQQIGAYALLVGFNYAFTLAVVALFPSKWLILSRTIALLITTLWNYFFYKRFFNKGMKDKKELKELETVTGKKVLFGTLLSLPTILFFYQYIFTGSKLIGGDFDYYAQAYEAFRISVLHFYQFPLWNPWMSGGVPLFANPQFGLFSLQSLLVLPFGAIYGLKVAYVIYALAGFWGMYILCHKAIKASALRSVLISYVWIFCGFFAGHNISHVTTASFFLLPWLIYILVTRNKKYSWLWFGLILSVIVLSSIDFVLLMIIFILAALFIFMVSPITIGDKLKVHYKWLVTKTDFLFILKSGLVVFVLCGYRFILAFAYVSANPRPSALLHETMPGIPVLLQGLFLPVGTLLKVPAHLQWGWGEYSMYMGLGVTVAFVLCIVTLIVGLFKKGGRKDKLFSPLVWAMIIIGVLGFLFAIGNFGWFSPYHLLKLLPGFSQTRVSSRWLFLTSFAILIFLAAWRKNIKIINALLALSVIELFFTFGPPRVSGNAQIKLPSSSFSTNFTEYSSDMSHSIDKNNLLHSYYYATYSNKGEVYSDEPFVDTLDKVIGTNKCGININPQCALVLTHNAKVVYWSPNKIVISRTAPGNIELNMNVASGWRINNAYPFASFGPIDPTVKFVLPSNEDNYNLIYAPKFSPQWITWRLSKVDP